MKTEAVGDTSPSGTDELAVGVVRGGESEEREISLKTGKAVAKALRTKSCRVREYDTGPNLLQRLDKDEIDVVFLALHGKGGEDGTIQAMLEWKGIPFTGPGHQASALCMDKLRTRHLFDRVGIPSPEWFRLKPSDRIRNRKGFERMVVKPRSEGSSLGMSIVEPSELKQAVETAREYDDDVIVEDFIDGYEVTQGVFTDGEMILLPPIGIRPGHEFFDYETKYTKGLTEYDVPAELSQDELEAINSLTTEIAHEAETESLCRVDYILGRDDNYKLLEINTIPGLTETSLLPKAAGEAGIEFPELVWKLVRQALRERNHVN